ncbi:MAG: alpha-E domain-containing protein [Planctomycetota bacterium]
MISRVAESCFWMFRYIERLQNTARLLEANLGFVLDAELPVEHAWRPLVIVSGERERFDSLLGKSSSEDGDTVQEYLVWDERNPSSVLNSLTMARENARRIREVISEEMWNSLNSFWYWMRRGAGRRLYRSGPDRFYARVRDWPLEFFGITLETTLHEEPFDFMRLGMFLERAGQTARILDVKYHMVGPTTDRVPTPVEHASWLALLRSCSAFEAFFKRHSKLPIGPDVAGFLLFEKNFPRSVRFCTERSQNYLKRIRASSQAFGTDTAARVEETLDKLENGTTDAFIQHGLHLELTDLVDRITGICDAVHREYFAPPLPDGCVVAGHHPGEE